MLPHDFPPFQTVKTYFYKLQRDGTWERVNDALRGQVRQEQGREDPDAVGAQILKEPGQHRQGCGTTQGSREQQGPTLRPGGLGSSGWAASNTCCDTAGPE